MNTVPVPKVDVVKRKSALGVDGKSLSVTLGFAANDSVWDFDCRECKANDYVVADAIKLEPVSTQTVSGLYFIHNDHLGTPKLITNISGTIVWQQHTTPFGEVTDTLATGINNLKSFPGQYRDSDTGYSYNYFRDYDPSLGRYLQSDPIGLGGGYNTYAYVGGNPIGNIDPLGLELTSCTASPQAALACGNVVRRTGAVIEHSVATAKILQGCPGDMDPCNYLRDEIKKAKDKLEHRYYELLIDRFDLFNQAYREPNLGKRKGTWRGHLTAYWNQRERLRNLLNAARELGCDNYDSTADYWYDKEAPKKPMGEE